MTPKLSVVIASVNGLSCIEECLEHLEALPERHDIEILVLDRRRDETAAVIAKRFPNVRVFPGLYGKSIPELRWAGMQCARAGQIAVIEDHCMAPPHWVSEILRFADSPYGVVGGPVENGSRERIIDWAFFLAEYGACMPPLRDGESNGVPGNNAVYRRDILPLSEPFWAGVWESFLQQELLRRNVKMYLHGGMTLYHKKSFGLGEMMQQRFLYSRSFAAMRAQSMSMVKRLIYSALSAALPALLLCRITTGLIRKRRNIKEFVAGLPVIGLFLLSWGAGEMAGYIAGDGNSLVRVE
jgi:Glycosyl transferase family 2